MAATGTPTPNIGLRIPLGTDPASVDDINYNSNLIDTKLGAVGNNSVQDQIDDLNSKITNSTITSLTSNGLTCSYIVRSGFCYVNLYGSPTTTENITFTVPKALLGEYLTCGQWGNTANIIQVFIDQNTTTLIIRNHTQNNMNVCANLCTRIPY